MVLEEEEEEVEEEEEAEAEEEVEGDAEEEDVDLGFMVFIIAPVGPAAIARVLPHMGRSMSREAHYTVRGVVVISLSSAYMTGPRFLVQLDQGLYHIKHWST